MRYEDWNRKSQFDRQAVAANSRKVRTESSPASNSRQSATSVPQASVANYNLLREDEDSQQYNDQALRQARQKANNARKRDDELISSLHETRAHLEKEIHRKLVEQLTKRAQKQSTTPEEQALIEKLYLDLRLINPELAFATLKASAVIESDYQQQQHQQQQHEKVVTTSSSSKQHNHHHQQQQQQQQVYHQQQYHQQQYHQQQQFQQQQCEQLVYNQESQGAYCTPIVSTRSTSKETRRRSKSKTKSSTICQ